MEVSETKNRVFENEEQFLGFARSYLSEAFPNPERDGCPPTSKLMKWAEEPTRSDRPVSKHLTSCSPCFNEYIARLERVRIRSRRLRFIRRIELSGALAFAGLLLVFTIGRHYIPAHHTRLDALQVKAPKSPGVPITSGRALMIDLENASPTRGAGESNGALLPQSIPASPSLDLTLKLPIGSRDQEYATELQSDGHVLWSGSAHSHFENHHMLLRVPVDFSQISPGAYELVVTAKGFHVALPVLIKRSSEKEP